MTSKLPNIVWYCLILIEVPPRKMHYNYETFCFYKWVWIEECLIKLCPFQSKCSGQLCQDSFLSFLPLLFLCLRWRKNELNKIFISPKIKFTTFISILFKISMLTCSWLLCIYIFWLAKSLILIHNQKNLKWFLRLP